MELWEAAQAVGREHAKVRDYQPGDPRPDRPLRSRIRCNQCKRRMCVKPTRAGNGKTYVYWVCPHNPADPRHAAKNPGHVRAAVTDHDMTAAVDHIISALLGHDRAAMLAAALPATQAEQDQRNQQHSQELRLQAAQNETAQNGLITQLAQMGSDTSPMANAMRERITAQFNDLYTHAQAIEAELDALTAAQAPAPDTTLLDELPYAALNLAHAPEHVKAALYNAFDIHALYRQPIKQATIWATITDTSPGTIAALLTDPRTDHDTFGNLQPAAIAWTAIHYPGPASRAARFARFLPRAGGYAVVQWP